jgi:hypothetical protein
MNETILKVLIVTIPVLFLILGLFIITYFIRGKK